jgi:hypothetical protein
VSCLASNLLHRLCTNHRQGVVEETYRTVQKGKMQSCKEYIKYRNDNLDSWDDFVKALVRWAATLTCSMCVFQGETVVRLMDHVEMLAPAGETRPRVLQILAMWMEKGLNGCERKLGLCRRYFRPEVGQAYAHCA